jgi:hypothetical protein
MKRFVILSDEQNKMPYESLADFHKGQKKFMATGGCGFILVYQYIPYIPLAAFVHNRRPAAILYTE